MRILNDHLFKISIYEEATAQDDQAGRFGQLFQFTRRMVLRPVVHQVVRGEDVH
jgi:hypothetical protein